MNNQSLFKPTKKAIDAVPRLSPVAEKLIAAVEAELGSIGFTARNKINDFSKTFPYDHRTLANRDVLGTGPKEKILIGKRIFYSNESILEMLREDLIGR